MAGNFDNCKLGDLLYTLLRIMEIRDASLYEHALRTAELSLQLGSYLNISDEEMTSLRYGSLLHDIGMLAMPDFISFKAGSLSADEWIIIRQHPEYGVSMLDHISLLKDALPIIENHQECWNGSGYPNGIQGDEIPFLARMVTITNTYDALTSDKIYRPGWSKTDALILMNADSEKVFDPSLLASFAKMLAENQSKAWRIEEIIGLA